MKAYESRTTCIYIIPSVIKFEEKEKELFLSNYIVI